MQTKTTPVQLDIKTARSVLRAKLLHAIGEQRADRARERELLDQASASKSDSRADDLRVQAHGFHRERIDRRRFVRYLAVAYAFALGRPYAAQEAKCARPIDSDSLADELLDAQVTVSSSLKHLVREDVKSWLKGEPTSAQREALAKAEAAIEAGVFEAAQ